MHFFKNLAVGGKKARKITKGREITESTIFWVLVIFHYPKPIASRLDDNKVISVTSTSGIF